MFLHFASGDQWYDIRLNTIKSIVSEEGAMIIVSKDDKVSRYTEVEPCTIGYGKKPVIYFVNDDKKK